MTRLALALLISCSVLPLHAQCRHETAAADVMIGAAPGLRGSPTIASDGDRFLAVWIDKRSAQTAVYGARFDDQGALLDPIGLRIADVEFSPNERVGVVWTGESYYVAWSDWGSNGVHGQGILGVRVGRDGEILGEPKMIIENGGDLGSDTAVATNGKNIIVAHWRGYVVLDLNGNPEIYNARPSNVGAFVVPRGSGFLFLEAKPGPQEVMTLDESGNVIESTVTFPLYTYIGGGACSGDDCLVITYDGSFTKPSLVPLDSSGRRVGDSSVTVPVNGRLLWHVDSYFILGATQSLRLDRTGHPVEQPRENNESFRGSIPAAVSNGHRIGVAWKVDAAEASSVFGSVVSSGVSTLLSRGAAAQSPPVIAWSGVNYLAAWTEYRGLRVGRISPDGRRADGPGTMLGAPSTYFTNLRAIFNGQDYGVAWIQPSDPDSPVYYARISADPTVAIDGNATPIANVNASSFSLASNGSSTLLVWSDAGPISRILAAPIDRGGAIVGTPVVVAFAPPAPPSTLWPLRIDHPSAAWNGSEWLVAWDVEKNSGVIPEFPTYFGFAVAAVRLAPSLTPLDTPITLSIETDSVNTTPFVASNGNEFAVAWTGYGTTTGVRLRHVASNGSPLDTAPAVLSDGRVVDMLWDGSNYDISVQRSPAAYNPNGFDASTNDAIMLRTPAGISFEVQTIPISTTAESDLAGALVVGPNGAVVPAYSRFDQTVGGVLRAFIGLPCSSRARAVRAGR
jgi:hypothetical protein